MDALKAATTWLANRRGAGIPACLVLVALACLLSGCAALTNPVAAGIPVRRLAPEFLGEPREDEEPIPLSYLRQKPPDVYRLEPGDILGIWVEGVLGEKTQPPPVQVSETGDQPPGIGFPIPVREDGTIALPFVEPINVKGMTLVEAEKAIRDAYTVKKQILQPGRERIIVTLMRPRRYHVLVIREDSGGLTVGTEGVIGSTKRGTGSAIDLPAYKNDVLNALAVTGGLPGLDANNEVVIQRGYLSDKDGKLPPHLCPDFARAGRDGIETIRIPLRTRPGEPPDINPESIILKNGDILYISARDTEVFYTGGLLPPGEFVLPRDYDLDVLEAVVRIGGPLVSGGIQGSNLTGNLLGTGLGNPSPSLVVVLRKTAGGGQLPIKVDLNRALCDPRERILVQPGDLLILQETPCEAFVRYLTLTLRFNYFARIFEHQDAFLTNTATFP